jgi:phage shock protein C
VPLTGLDLRGEQVEKKLQRSRSEKMVAGVCGGLAAYFGVDPTLVRAVFAVVGVLGAGVLLYLVLWAVIPLEPPPPYLSDNVNP